MWVSFSARSAFAIKLYVGGVNAISGVPHSETVAEGGKCRATAKTTSKHVQDYMVAPGQLWLDGIATKDGHVRQFVSMPIGEGCTVEAQITGQESV